MNFSNSPAKIYGIYSSSAVSTVKKSELADAQFPGSLKLRYYSV